MHGGLTDAARLVEALALALEELGVLLIRGLEEQVLSPHVGSEEAVGLLDGVEGGHDEVAEGLRAASGRGEDILNAGVGEDLLGDRGGDDASAAGRGDEAHADGAALAGHAVADGVGETELVAPVASSDGDDGQLRLDGGALDGVGDFLGALDAETDVTVHIADDDEGFEAGSLTGSGLLLDRHDLDVLVAELLLRDEVVDDLVLLDGEREEEDLLERLDQSSLDEAAHLGDGDPLLLAVAGTSSVAAASATATSAEATTALAAAVLSLDGSSLLVFVVSHLLCFQKGVYK